MSLEDLPTTEHKPPIAKVGDIFLPAIDSGFERDGELRDGVVIAEDGDYLEVIGLNPDHDTWQGAGSIKKTDVFMVVDQMSPERLFRLTVQTASGGQPPTEEHYELAHAKLAGYEASLRRRAIRAKLGALFHHESSQF